MKRTLPWALFALFPLASLIAVASLEQIANRVPGLAADSGTAAFMVRYWWAALFAILLAQIIWFVVAALRNRALPNWARILWSAALVALGPVSAPVYWWLHGARGK